MDNDLQQPDEQSCPKRLWVLLTLSDDELMGEDGVLPPGLQFHLSRCESCRALAERLLSASGMLRMLSDLGPPEDLAEAANSQALTALSGGAKLTGRVDVPDEPDLAPTQHMPFGWRRFGRYATAAAVFIAVGLFGLSSYVDRPGDISVDHRPIAGPKGRPFARGGESRKEVKSLDRVPDVADSPSEGTREHLADADGIDPVRTGKRRIRRHHSHIEAAMSDDPQGAQAAIVLPDTAQRNLGWGRVFDTVRTLESTKVRKRKR